MNSDTHEAATTWNQLVLEHWSNSDAPAVIDDDEIVSGHELLELAAGASDLFDRLGFGPGDPVPALMDESATAIAMLVGGAMSRRPLAPLGTKLSVSDLAAAIDGLGAHRMLASPDRAALAEEVAASCGVELTIIDQPLDRRTPLPGSCDANDIVLVLHTSGTTGRAKAVYMPQHAFAARVGVYQEAMGIGPGDRYCSASPFYHTASASMDVTVLGMGVGIIPQDWFSIDNWRRAARLGVTCALLVPTMMDMLLEAGALTDASPKVLQYGAMPIHPDTLRAVHEALPATRMVQIFGQTEASPIACLRHDDHLRALDDRPDLLLSVGHAVSGAALRVEDPDEAGIGEIAISGAHIFQIDPDGWRRTGDLGTIDEEGYLYLHGRVNDRIIRGGENIYPIELELLIAAHPGVREVAIVGIPDRRWGEIVWAFVAPTDPTHPPDPDELKARVSDETAHFKVPAGITFVDELPRNPSGKILRRALRDSHAAEAFSKSKVP
jgi:acyl-CoA synthetase (AMP-forming)/AMP-acid ligase II